MCEKGQKYSQTRADRGLGQGLESSDRKQEQSPTRHKRIWDKESKQSLARVEGYL